MAEAIARQSRPLEPMYPVVFFDAQGLLVRDFESSFLILDPAEVSAFNDLLGHSIT